MWFEKKRKISFVLMILIAIEIYYFSSLSGGVGTGPGIPLIALTYHFIVFFLLAFFLLATLKSKNKIKLKHIIITLIISILYAISDEIHQFFVPMRHGGASDVLIDLLGIFCAVLVYLYASKKTN